MYAPLYNRLCGWTFFTLGLLGLILGHIGEYVRLTQTESLINVCVGLIAMVFARTRLRYAVVTSLFLGILLFLWGIWGAAWPTSMLGTSEPLEILIRLLGGTWGLFVSVQDVLQWRRT